MRILVAVKIVPDGQDIQVAPDATLDFSKARPVVSEYDLNALEAAAQLAAATDSTTAVITVGSASIDSSALKKSVLARGMDELFMTADDACTGIDAHATAQALAELVSKAGNYDVIICGDGSADLYAKQTGAQLASRLGLPYVAGIISMEQASTMLVCKRKLENEVENIEVPLPAIISVLPEIAIPRICGMKDILSAGKKPMNVAAADVVPDFVLETVSCMAPEQTERKCDITDAGDDGAIESFAAALKAAL